jgi:glutathione S-transferase
MTPVLFYGVPEGCSFGSIVALEWLAKPYHLCRVHMPDISQGPEYRAINPIGETPALLTEQGMIISESTAILQHIEAELAKQGRGRRQGTEEFDQLNRMLSFLATRFFSAFNPFWIALEYVDEPAKKSVLHEEGHLLTTKAFEKLELMLGGRDWLVGSNISVADAYFAGVARWNDIHEAVAWADFPSARALFERVQQDPAVQFAHAIEAEREVEGSGRFRGHVLLTQMAKLHGTRLPVFS